MNIIDVATPAGSTKKKFVDDHIREFKLQVRDCLMAISGYPDTTALRTTTWTTDTRPTTNLVDGLSGFNSTLGVGEKYDATEEEWVPMVSDAFVKALVTAAVPLGLISLWSGASTAIPTGWALCDGSNSTPNLVDKFVVGAGSSYAVGATGGEATHKLTVDEMPAHSHPTGASTTPSIYEHGDDEDHDNVIPDGGTTTGSTGGGGAHNNLPPYYALCYIMRIS